MSFLAKLNLGASDYNILTVDYELVQQMDHNNRPNGAPRGGLVNLRIEANNSNEILEWMVRPNMLKNGNIVFYRRDANSPMKKLEFKDAFCVYLKEQFLADGATPMITTLTLSARELKISNITITNPWPGMKSGGSGNGASSNSISTFQVVADND